MPQTPCACYHCGLDVPPNSDFSLELQGQQRRFCCVGCQAVASAIVEGGLSNFYQFRNAKAKRPDQHLTDYQVYDLPEVQQEFVDDVAHTALGNAAEKVVGSAASQNRQLQEKQAQLLLGGITCAACVWLIEQHLSKLPGVVSVKVNASTHRCLVRWQPEQQPLSRLMQSLADIGFEPLPATENQHQQLRQKESRSALMRLAVAGFGMMQVGMVAIALYAGADASWESFFRWVGLIIATPIVFYSAKPFFSAAWRSVRTLHLTMDVPVSLAIGGAYGASCWATVFGGGEVYFDSVSMFTFFLLLGRYLEMRARHRNGIDSERLAQLLPVTTEVWRKGTWQVVTLKEVQVGNRVLVPSGSVIPCDGVVVFGCSGVVETLLTGEPDAVQKNQGDAVIAGTLNTESALQIEVTAVGRSTRLSAIEQLVEQARQNKPSMVAMADRLAGYFVAAVLLVAVVVAALWWRIDASHALWVVLSVLVVTCPCALSLASPTALTSAISWLRQQGLLVTREHVLEGLPSIQRVVFDKTGTLTEGAPQVFELRHADGSIIHSPDSEQLLQVCAALELGSRHPIAKAFESYIGVNEQTGSPMQAQQLKQHTALGVEGVVEGKHYRFGKPLFVLGDRELAAPNAAGQWLLLSCGGQPLAWIGLQDRLRANAAGAVKVLQRKGVQVELISGDDSAEVERVAAELGIEQWRADQTPDQKLAAVQSYQQAGEKVLMVGDGINDVPVLSGAFISVAMGGASDLAQTGADSVLLGDDLTLLSRAIDCAHFTRKVIRQNLGWALGYNLLALPAAAMGLIPPWAAAIGMSTSSLIVVANALRIGRQSSSTV